MENAPVTEPRSAVPEEFRTPRPVGSVDPKITERQREFILGLLDERVLPDRPDMDGRVDTLVKCLRISEDPEEYGMGKNKASKIIEWLLTLPKKELAAKGVDPSIPDGYYALRDMPGHKNEITFYRLNTGKRGRWQGFQFINMVVGGGMSGVQYPVRGSKAREDVYAAIEKQDPLKSRQLYGQEIGQCGVCNRLLTDDTSRAYGIGPVCRAAL